MELATIFLIWLAVTVIDNLAKRKKRRIPPPERNSPDFEIPTIQNAGEEVPIFIESPVQAEIRQKNSPSRPKKVAVQEKYESEADNKLELSLTPSNVMNALIMSEILDKPKALRHRRH